MTHLSGKSRFAQNRPNLFDGDALNYINYVLLLLVCWSGCKFSLRLANPRANPETPTPLKFGEYTKFNLCSVVGGYLQINAQYFSYFFFSLLIWPFALTSVWWKYPASSSISLLFLYESSSSSIPYEIILLFYFSFSSWLHKCRKYLFCESYII